MRRWLWLNALTVLFWLWLRLVRGWKSPLLYWIFRKTIYRGELPDIWSWAKQANMDDFSALLNGYEYRWQFGRGIVDWSPQQPDFFFVERDNNRDCAHWARMWLWWAKHNNLKAWEVVVIDGIRLTSLHMATVIYDRGQFYLANYWIEGVYSSFEEAVEQFRIKRLTQSGPHTNLIWATNKGV